MSSRFTHKYRHLAQLYRDRGLLQVLGHVARAALSVLYSRQVQYIMVKRLDRPAATAPGTGAAEEGEIECVVADTSAALEAMAQEFSASFRDSLDDLQKRVAQGCVVFLARRPKEAGPGKVVVGYYLCEPGVFSALGRKKPISSDTVFGHYAEVLPQYRGERISEFIGAVRDEYFRRKGFKKRCAVVSVQNRSSLQSSKRKGSTIVGTVQRLSLLGGLFIWETPWEEIEKALRVGDEAERPEGGA